MKAMLDTSVLIAGIPSDIIDELESHCSSMICRAELARGMYAFEADRSRHQRAAVRRELLSLLDAVPGFWVGFDRAASDAYGRLTAVPRSAIRQKDALIASHALARELPLITADKGFTRFPDVAVEFIEVEARL